MLTLFSGWMQIRCFCGCISVAPCSVRKKRQAGMCCWVQQPGRHNVLLYIVYSVFFRPLQEDYTWRSIDFIITKRVLVKLKSTWTEVFHGFSRLDASISEARSLFFSHDTQWYPQPGTSWVNLLTSHWGSSLTERTLGSVELCRSIRGTDWNPCVAGRW